MTNTAEFSLHSGQYHAWQLAFVLSPDWSLLGTILELRLHRTFVVQTDKGSVLIRNRRYLKPVHWLLFFNVPVLSPALAGGGGGGGDVAVLGYGGEGRCGVSYLGSGHELKTYIHTYFIILPEGAFQRQYAWDVNQTRRRRRENNRYVLVAVVVALVVVVLVEGKQ